jgi:hypothetical protein
MLHAKIDMNDNQNSIKNLNYYNFEIDQRTELSRCKNSEKMAFINEFDQEKDENDITLSVLYQGNKLGCSYYDKSKKTLFYLNDLPGNIFSAN